jgi:hypothetical protein
MKASKILSYLVILLIIVFSTSLFALAAPATSAKISKFPAVMRINAADVGLSSAIINSNMENAKKAGQNISKECGEVATWLSKVEQALADFRKQETVCKNKSYTVEDQKQAGCTENITVAQCSKSLYVKCMSNAYNTVITNTVVTLSDVQKMEAAANDLHKSILYIQQHLGDNYK